MTSEEGSDQEQSEMRAKVRGIKRIFWQKQAFSWVLPIHVTLLLKVQLIFIFSLESPSYKMSFNIDPLKYIQT